ncbi:MAG: fibronectin type III domain-containing protein [Ruminococcus sp.]|nr:fibronectin type III domain-containing protein [Ruminococcus sp.]
MKRTVSLAAAAIIAVSAFSLPAGAEGYRGADTVSSTSSVAANEMPLSLGNEFSTETTITVNIYYYGGIHADGFQVLYRKAGTKKWKKKNITNRTIKLSGLKKATKYELKVRAFVNNTDGTKEYGKFCSKRYFTMNLNYAKWNGSCRKWKKKLGGYARIGFSDINNDNIPELLIHGYTAAEGHRLVVLTYNKGKPKRAAILKGYSSLYRKGKKYFIIKTAYASGGKCTLSRLKLKGNKLTKSTVYSGSDSYDTVYSKYLKKSSPTCFIDSCEPGAFNKSYFYVHKPWKEAFGIDAFEI